MSPPVRSRHSFPQKRNRKKQEPTKPSVNHLKKRRRDLQRLLSHSESLPADVRLGYERELQSCNHDIDLAEKALRRSQMIGKYHKARFFERKKATRALKKAKKDLSEADLSNDRSLLEAQVHRCQVDLNYTQYFPLDMDYVSLYVGKKDPVESVNRESPMWKRVETEMANGRLQALREGKLNPQLASDPDKSGDTEQQPVLVNEASHESSSKSHRFISDDRRKQHQAKLESSAEQVLDSDQEDGAAFFE